MIFKKDSLRFFFFNLSLLNMNKYKAHQNFLKLQIKLAQAEFKGIRFFDRHVGLFYNKNGVPVRVNRPGMSDVWALLKVNGYCYHIEIEFKTGSAGLSSSQKKWRSFCAAMQVPFFLVNQQNELVPQLKDFLGEEKISDYSKSRAKTKLPI